MFHLYELYKQGKGIKNDRWVMPYNMVMMLLLCVGSFFMPKLVIAIAISYFISTEVYLLSDTVTTATKCDLFENLKFERMFEFHVFILSSFVGWNRFQCYFRRKNSINPSISRTFS